MRSLARQTQDPVAWVVASLREDFKEELISRDARGRFASKKGGGKRSSAASSRRNSSLGTVAGVSAATVAATVGVAALGAVYVGSEIRRASDDISGFDYPTEDPVDYSRYDDLKPGELLYKGFPVGPSAMRGGKNKGMLHYAVYVGKDPETGNHKLVECGEDPMHPGIPAVIESTIEDNIEAMPKEKRAVSSHYKAVPKEERLPRKNEPPLSPAEIIERANLLVGQPFRYNAVTNNCESIARAIVGDEARTTQGEKISALGKKIMSSIFDERVFKGKWEDYGRSEFVKSSAEMAEILSDYSQQRLSEAMWRELKHVQGDWRTKKANSAKLKENIYAAAVAAAKATSRRQDSEDEGHNRLADLLGLEPIDVYAKKVEKFAQASEDEVTQHLVRRQMWSNYFQLVLSSIHVTINGKTGDLKEPRKDEVRWVIHELRKDGLAPSHWWNTGDPTYREMMAMAVVGSLRNDYKEELHPRDALGRFAKKGYGGSSRQSAAGKGRKSSEGGDSAWDRIAFPGGVATGLGIGALAIGGLAVGGGIGAYQTIKEEGEKGTSDVSHMDFPGKGAEYDFSRYDDLEPGTMIRKAFRFPGQTEGRAFLHYAVYVGKDDKTGEHMVVHAVPDPKDPTGTVAIVKQSIEDAVKRGGDHELENHSYYEAMPANERINGKGVPSMEEAVQRAESLIGQPYDYRSTRSNCESFARLITEGVAYETQGRGTASKAGMEMVANLTKVAQDYSRSRSKIWKGREPKDAHGYAELLAKMQAGALSESARAVMAENRAAWESAPELPVGGATKRNLREMFEMTMRDFANPARNRSDAEDDEDIFEVLDIKTPAEYQKDIDRACEGQSKPLQRETARFMWSNYLQMFFALASDSKSPPKSLREDAERPWDEEGEDSLGESGDCEREDSWEEEKHPRDAQGRFAPASSARQSATSREFLLGGGNAYAKSQGKKTGLAGDAISAGQSYTKSFADDPKFVAAQKHMAEAEARNHEATAQILARRERGQQPTREEVANLIKAQADANRVLHREFLPIATKKMEEVRNELLNDSPISKEEAKAIVGQRQIKGRPFPEPLIGFQVKGMLEEHTRLIGEDLPTLKKIDIYSLTYGRSYADPANGVVAIAGDQINKPIIFHEATHHMEASNPRALRTAEDWVKQRNRGRGEMPLSLVNPAYGPGERTMKDEFFNPYVGKLYKEGGKVAATEALSMGMQYFDSPKSMAMLYAVDPEHFHMTVGVIRPKGKGKSRKDSQEIRLDGLLRVPQGSSDYDKALIGRMNDSLKLNEKTGCFLWTASTRKDGYGQVKVNGELKSAHKVAYTLIKGKVPEGQLVCHKCDNPACCNPAHLFLGDSSNNVQDMVKKGRNSNGRGDSIDNLITLLREDVYKGGPRRFGIWFEGRRTPIVVTAASRGEAIKRARLLKRRGGGKVTSARLLNEQENRVADRRRWVRTGPNGEKPGESKIRGYGPRPKGFEE